MDNFLRDKKKPRHHGGERQGWCLWQGKQGITWYYWVLLGTTTSGQKRVVLLLVLAPAAFSQCAAGAFGSGQLFALE